MKRIIFFTALFCFANLLQAQIVVTSTNASTQKIKPKSIREKGWVIRPEIGAGFINKTDPFSMNFLGSGIYRINPYFETGAGLGFVTCERFETLSLPIFANIRAYFSNTKWSPFCDIKVGYNIGLKEGSYYSSYYNNSQSYYFYSGLFSEISLGLNYKSFDVMMAFSMYRYKDPSYSSYKDTICGIFLKFCYNFCIKK